MYVLLELDDLKQFLREEIRKTIIETLSDPKFQTKDRYLSSTELYEYWGVSRTTGVKLKKRLIKQGKLMPQNISSRGKFKMSEVQGINIRMEKYKRS